MPVKSFITRVKSALKMQTQPNSYTCQSTAIALAVGGDIMGIRAQLISHGQAGDPHNMGRFMRAKIGDRYSFMGNASLYDAEQALKAGAFCIVHGWFTKQGHVIGLDGLEEDGNGDRFNVKDPWSEFSFAPWDYNKGSLGFDGFYSARGIYAACVAGQSYSHAAQVYRNGELDSGKRGMWLHIIKP